MDFNQINAYAHAQGGLGSGLQQASSAQYASVPPTETVQQVNCENLNRLRQINQALIQIRARLFGEVEAPQKDQPPTNPVHSIAASASLINDQAMEAQKQLDSILARL